MGMARVLANLFFGVSASDALTFAGTSLVLMASGIVATYIPARRAAKVDPLVALRYE
jgi:putative ABC transport system permease protein